MGPFFPEAAGRLGYALQLPLHVHRLWEHLLWHEPSLGDRAPNAIVVPTQSYLDFWSTELLGYGGLSLSFCFLLD